MLQLDLTLSSPAQNLACDEVLLDLCENGAADEVLRFWEPTQYFVVVGYANHVSVEVNLDYCRQQGIPVLRRCTGGGTVLQGLGCLNYTLLMRLDGARPLQSISSTNDFIMERHRAALAGLLKAAVEKRGHTDLAISGLKFCGNAQRRRKRFVLFHGCFLLGLDLDLVEKALRMPSREPDYRRGRSHADFIMNLGVSAHSIKAALLRTWEAGDPLTTLPLEEIELLGREKYASDEWNTKF